MSLRRVFIKLRLLPIVAVGELLAVLAGTLGLKEVLNWLLGVSDDVCIYTSYVPSRLTWALARSHGCCYV